MMGQSMLRGYICFVFSLTLTLIFGLQANDDLFNLIVTVEPFAHALSLVLIDHPTVSSFRLINKTCAAVVVSENSAYKEMISIRKTKLFDALTRYIYNSDTTYEPDDFIWHPYGSLCHGQIHCADSGAKDGKPHVYTWTLNVKSAYLIAEEHDIELRHGIRKELFRLKIDEEKAQSCMEGIANKRATKNVL